MSWIGSYSFLEPGAGDGSLSDSSSNTRAFRGGSYRFAADNARSALRRRLEGDQKGDNVSVRPARRVLD